MASTRRSRHINRAYVLRRLEEARGAWVPWSEFVRDGWDRNAVWALHEEGVIERRAETLTSDRSPQWLGRALAEHGFENPWSPEASDFADAYRLPTGANAADEEA